MINKIDIRIPNKVNSVKKIAFSIIDRTQDFPKPDVIAALGVLWLLACEQNQVAPADVLNTAHRMLRTAMDSSAHPHFKAIQDYMNEEWKIN